METKVTPPQLTKTLPRRSWNPDLLPNSFASPWALLLAVVPSELVLLFLNCKAAWLTWGELNSAQSTKAIVLGAVLGVFVLAAGLRLVLGREKPVSLVESSVVLATHIAYLWLALVWIDQILPSSVTDWIVRPERLILYQFTLATPAIGFAMLRLACFSAPGISRARDVTLSAVTIGGAIASFFALAIGLAGLHEAFGDFTGWLMVGFWIVATVICLGALLRLATMLFNLLHYQEKSGHFWLAMLVGLVLPIAGLLLNRLIPFPYNFQSDEVYFWTLLNGALLLLPIPAEPRRARLFWWLRCVSFPFSIYFLVVFLPFLPLSIPAILAMGAGFLMLAPVAFFMLHGNLVVLGWQQERDRRNWFSPTMQMLAAFLVVPLLYLAQCYSDRLALNRALDYVYRPNYNQPGARLADSKKAAVALEHLRDFKAGLGLPFLSETYSWVLFDNLVLPDAKMNSLYQVFTGSPLPATKGEAINNFFGNSERRNGWTPPRVAPPQTSVILEAKVTTLSEGPAMRARLDLVVSNPTSSDAEFASALTLPAGVFIADYALFMGDQPVPGQLFEKKTALWVYEKIVKVSRVDPGLLAYTGKNTLDVKIFPVGAGQTRHAQMDFVYPADTVRTLQLGDRQIALPTTAPLPQNVAAGSSVALAGDGTWKTQALQRRPVLFLLVDASFANAPTTAQVQAARVSLRPSLPPETRVVGRLVNFENRSWMPTARIDQSSLPALPKAGSGGFWPQRAMREILLTEKLPPEEFPLFAVISNRWGERFKEENFLLESRLNPDVSGFAVLTKAGNQFITWDDGKTRPLVPENLQPAPVAILTDGKVQRAVRADSAGEILHFSSGALQLYQPASGQFAALTDVTTLPADAPYSRALQQAAREEQLLIAPGREPELLPEIAASAKATRILTPSMAYIVVENSAQWKMLAITEKQKLNNKKELEIEEPQVTPEPGTWALLIVGGGLFLLRSGFWRRKSEVQLTARDRKLAL